MRILVTGGGGFLGGAIVRRLVDEGHAVRSFSRGDYPHLRDLGVEVVRGDLSDAEAVAAAVEGCDVVFHPAAKVAMWGSYAAFHATNVTGTANVIAACRRHGVSKLIYTSTPSVAHAGGDIEGADESLPYPEHFHAHYPATKAEAEQRVLSSNDERLATIALRPHLVWGPDDPNVVAKIVARGKAGKIRLLGKTPKKVDTTYIDNAVDAHLLAMEQLSPGAPCAGKAYFIANDEPVLQEEMINAFLEAAGVPPVSKRVPVGVAIAAGAVFEAIYGLLGKEDEPPMTRFIARQLATAHWYDLSAAKRDLGYAPRVSNEEGLRRLKASFGADHSAGGS